MIYWNEKENLEDESTPPVAPAVSFESITVHFDLYFLCLNG